MPRLPRRVLYVEDNSVNVFVMEAIFELRPGLALAVAGTGTAALSMALATPPELLLLDMSLPDTDGAALLACLREHETLRGVPAVAVSADAFDEDIERAHALGFCDYWTKPLDVQRTLTALDTLLPEY